MVSYLVMMRTVAENDGEVVVVDVVVPIVSYLSSFLFKELLFKEMF